MARAKHTVRAEARRRYRQAGSLPGDDADMALDDAAPKPAAPASRPATQARPTPSPSERPGFLSAFKAAYHPARIGEDLRALPKLLTSRALLGGLALVAGGALAWLAFPAYTGSAFAWELLVIPGSALGPQLVAGFFAPRASYLLGLVVAVAQSVTYLIVTPMVAARLGAGVPPIEPGVLVTQGFLVPAISGTLFAAAAAWYRRFLALSSPKRMGAAARGSSGRPAAKAAPSKRGGGR